MAIPATTVWEIRSGGSDNNGGGFDSVTSGGVGTDFSQQASAQFALTSVTTSGAGATFLTASAANSMIGNIAHVVSGTNFTAGFYMITSVSVGVSVTCDANVCTGAGASGVINIGGALHSLGKVLGSASANQAAVKANKIWVKNDSSYTIGAGDSLNASGGSDNPIAVEGYTTTRGDGFLGRNITGDGKLITTNMPIYQYSATFRLVAGTGQLVTFKNIIFSSAGAGVSNSLLQPGAGCVFTQCVITNPSTNAAAGGAFCNANEITYENCDVFLTGATGAGNAIATGTSANARIIGCRIEVTSTNSTSSAVNIGGAAVVTDTTVIGHGGTIGVLAGSTAGVLNVFHNTITGFAVGVGVVTGNVHLHCIYGNMVTDSTTNAVDLQDTSVALFAVHNRFRDVTTINSGSAGWLALATGNITTGTGDSTDYVNAAGGDYRLVSTSPATSASSPAKGSMGALQRDQTGGGATVQPASSYIR